MNVFLLWEREVDRCKPPTLVNIFSYKVVAEKYIKSPYIFKERWIEERELVS